MGYTLGKGKREGVFGSLILAKSDLRGSLRYVGKVGSGFNDAELKRIHEALKNSPQMPAIDAKDSNGDRIDFTGVKSGIEVEVKFGEVSKHGVFRFPSLVKDDRGRSRIFFGGSTMIGSTYESKPNNLLNMLKDLVG